MRRRGDRSPSLCADGRDPGEAPTTTCEPRCLDAVDDPSGTRGHRRTIAGRWQPRSRCGRGGTDGERESVLYGLSEVTKSEVNGGGRAGRRRRRGHHSRGVPSARKPGLTGAHVGCGGASRGLAPPARRHHVEPRSCSPRRLMAPPSRRSRPAPSVGSRGRAGIGVACQAMQCGFCTPGMVVSTRALLAENPALGNMEEARRSSWQSDLCRCNRAT